MPWLLDCSPPVPIPRRPEADGWTPLHSTAISGNERLASVLLDAGGSVDALVADRAGATPLAYTLFYGHTAPPRPSPVSGRRRMTSGPRPDSATSRMHRWLRRRPPLPRGADAGMDFYGPTEWFPPRQGPVDDQLVIDESLVWSSRSGTRRGDGAPRRPGRRRQRLAVRGTPLLWAVYSGRIQAARHGCSTTGPTPTSDTTSAAKDTAPKPSPCTSPRNTGHSAPAALARTGRRRHHHRRRPRQHATRSGALGEQPEAAALLERHIGS